MERSVLVLEDDPNILALLEAVLHHDNSACTLVREGREALDELARRDFSAIVLDLLLPGMNGFEVLRQIKSTWPELLARTVVITAASDVTIRDRQELVQVRRVLRKPLDIDELCAEVRACAVLAEMSAISVAPEHDLNTNVAN